MDYTQSLLIRLIGLIPGLAFILCFLWTLFTGVCAIPSLLYVAFVLPFTLPKQLSNKGMNKVAACIIGFILGTLAAIPFAAIAYFIPLFIWEGLKYSYKGLAIIVILCLASGGTNSVLIIYRR
jgi:hypothetical protein